MRWKPNLEEGGTSSIPTPDPNAAEGTIDHALDILNKYSHPFILVGNVAHRWMGCASCVDGCFDIVLRKSQVTPIVIDLVETGYWTLVDCHTEYSQILESDANWTVPEDGEPVAFLRYLCEADIVLEWVGVEAIGFDYMAVWTDETFHIDVDDCKLVEVPELHAWSPFLVEKEFHPALRRDDGWFYGPNTLDDAGDRYRIFSTIFHRAKGARNTTPINVLSIPTYLDTLVYQSTHYENFKRELASIADWQIRNLTRYLFLELPHQRDSILFQVKAETENYLLPYFAKWKRKPHYVTSRSRGLVLVNDWDPASYPEDTFPPVVWKGRMSPNPSQASGSSSTGAAPE
ncbi:hypothetical protein V500_04127 [Pseudogymnoascus sp. VKM F-4518 (FW-2643)]|nr:hypothetical protein V500_04127 [Pseudogymnoascus sp. VKM F-4518 (FW-2643)]